MRYPRDAKMDARLIATDVVAASSRSGWAPGIDLRLVTDEAHGLFAIGDGYGPTYGGHYYSLALNPALDIVMTMARGDSVSLEHAFAEAQRTAREISLEFEAALQPRRGVAGHRRAALAVRPELASSTSQLFHSGVGISLVRIRSATLELGQVGMSRIYLRRGHDIQLCLLDHSLPSEMLRKYGSASSEYESALEVHRSQVTRLLGVTPECSVDYSVESVAETDQFLLCSDGVWNQRRETQLIPALFDAPEAAFAGLVADASSTSGGDAAAIRCRLTRPAGDSATK